MMEHDAIAGTQGAAQGPAQGHPEGPTPGHPDGLIFFARRSSGGTCSISRLEACAKYMHENWTATFGDFQGSHIHIAGTQCARKRLRNMHKVRITEFVQGVLSARVGNIRPSVELVVSSETGFLTNVGFLCEFFEQRNMVEWRFLVFSNRSTAFKRVDIYGVIENFHGRPAVLDEHTSSFLMIIGRANDAREALAGTNPDLGARDRNCNTPQGADRPELRGQERYRARARRIQVRQCPMCPRHYLTDGEFHAHAYIHGPGPVVPVLRNIDNDVDKRPARSSLHSFESTLARVWTCQGCGLKTSSHGTWENHPPKCRKNPERKAAGDLFSSQVIDVDLEMRASFECRTCFSGIAKEAFVRSHMRQEHDCDADGQYLSHKNGFKVVCPEPGCGFTFHKLFSLAAHCYQWHGWRPGSTFPEVEYRSFPQDTPNDPLVLQHAVTMTYAPAVATDLAEGKEGDVAENPASASKTTQDEGQAAEYPLAVRESACGMNKEVAESLLSRMRPQRLWKERCRRYLTL